ncbi:hypothetical protein ACN47E_001822 [Coniothyrium glycines]
MPYGRGGAGNFYQAQEANKKAAEDLEANRASISTADTTRPAPPPQPANASQEYAHMGRGGAGNWYQPTELQKEGTFSAAVDSTAAPSGSKPQVSTPWHPEGQEMPVARSGRGGAGNFVWRSEEQARKAKEEEDRKRELVREGVERDVEAGLAKPPGALLSKDSDRR